MHERMVAREVWGDKHRKGHFRHTANTLVCKYKIHVEILTLRLFSRH